MKMLDKILDEWKQAQRNNFHDAWGIVMREHHYYELKQELILVDRFQITDDPMMLLYGLVVIIADWFLDKFDDVDCLVVDEFLGRNIINENIRKEQERCI